jgi:hypothetical protein
MVRKKRKTQEEEILEVLKKEGFEEVPERELRKESNKPLTSWPECIAESNSSKKKFPEAA